MMYNGWLCYDMAAPSFWAHSLLFVALRALKRQIHRTWFCSFLTCCDTQHWHSSAYMWFSGATSLHDMWLSGATSLFIVCDSQVPPFSSWSVTLRCHICWPRAVFIILSHCICSFCTINCFDQHLFRSSGIYCIYIWRFKVFWYVPIYSAQCVALRFHFTLPSVGWSSAAFSACFVTLRCLCLVLGLSVLLCVPCGTIRCPLMLCGTLRWCSVLDCWGCFVSFVGLMVSLCVEWSVPLSALCQMSVTLCVLHGTVGATLCPSWDCCVP